MGDVIPLDVRSNEGGWLVCPHCGDEEGSFLPLCLYNSEGAFVASLVCVECTGEIHLNAGYLVAEQ